MSAPLPRRIVVALLTLCLAFLSVLVAADALRQSALAGPPDHARSEGGQKAGTSSQAPGNSSKSKSASSGAKAGGASSQAKGPSSAKKDSSPAASGNAQANKKNNPPGNANSPGQLQKAPGNSGNAPGNSGNAPGNSGNAPGNSGNAPGNSGNAPGNSGNAPGNSGNAPGNSGNAPGQANKPASPGAQGPKQGPPAARGGAGKIGICHATGSATNPYVYIRVSENALAGHGHHHANLTNDDIIGVSGPHECPGGGDGPGKVGICHATGSAKNPWVFIRVSENAVDAHLRHGDKLATSAGECPGGAPEDRPGKVGICRTDQAGGYFYTQVLPDQVRGGDLTGVTGPDDCPTRQADPDRDPDVDDDTSVRPILEERPDEPPAVQEGDDQVPPRPASPPSRAGRLASTGLGTLLLLLLGVTGLTTGMLLLAAERGRRRRIRKPAAR